ncbi:NYN domain-containing protein [Zavarzinella formosa]|uniref:NYN domain-containing protein n=1 Tax=Zavarzinella formosa TaxID=360055 RepID=UPI00030FBBCB|nr:NYN domain-containing protein [Zavarzinella formosa]
MRYLIDGYNLMHAIGLVRKNGGETGWLTSRRKLLDWLADQLAHRPSDSFLVVFDAQRSVGTLESNLHNGVKVLIARGQTADDVIEELLAEEINPKQLTVVSNDHRLRDSAWRNDCGWTTCGNFTETVLTVSPVLKPISTTDTKPDIIDPAEDAELLKIFSQPKPRSN